MQWLGNDDSTQQQTQSHHHQQQQQQVNNITSNQQQQQQQQQQQHQIPLTEIIEEDVVGGVSTLSMDPHVRAKLFPSVSRRVRTNPLSANDNQCDATAAGSATTSPMRLEICFEVASFDVELCNANGTGLVGLSFGDFLLTLKTPKRYETDLKISLRSLLVEDLLADKDTLGRKMIASRTDDDDYKLFVPPCVSRSCPSDVGISNTQQQQQQYQSHYGSLPDRLDTKKLYGVPECNVNSLPLPSATIGTVPPSTATIKTSRDQQQQQQDLVIIRSKLIDPSAPDFDTGYGSMRKSTVISLGSIDVVVIARCWVPLLDFFSITNVNNNDDDLNKTKTARSSAVTKRSEKIGNSSTSVTIRSLTMQALCTMANESMPRNLARARVNTIQIDIKRENERRCIHGHLDSVHVRHSSPGTYACCAERFVTIGDQALEFQYSCPPPPPPASTTTATTTTDNDEDDITDNDSELKLKISPFVYVHTKKFITELRAFFLGFSRASAHLDDTVTVHQSTPLPRRKSSTSAAPITRRRSSGNTSSVHNLSSSSPVPPSRMSLHLEADACVMLMPVHPASVDLLVFDVGRLTVNNTFTKTDSGTDERADNENDCNNNTYFDIQTWRLHDVDVYAAEAHVRDILTMNTRNEQPTLVFGDCAIVRRSASLLTEKCLLEIRIDKNLMPNMKQRKNGVADMTMHCRLSTLDATLDVHEYALIRGVLTHNLGEDTEHILPSVVLPTQETTSLSSTTTTVSDDVWTLSSLRIELLDVRVRFRSLSCINFVRSRLIVDSFSDLSQDVDLVSRQILITDERTGTTNVFREVLRPAKRSLSTSLSSTNVNDGSVQAEIHSRRRRDKSKFTVLLNNMRLMAITDWWKAARDFIFTQYEFKTDDVQNEFDPYLSTYQQQEEQQRRQQQQQQQDEIPFEFKLNITDSEIVLVEDTGQRDTNAVILRSTTLLTYRPNIFTTTTAHMHVGENLKPLSFSVNHLELFSCRFLATEQGADEDTALSIVDPVTVTADLSNLKLDVQLNELTVRVSYRDMLMFATMFESITRQTTAVSVNETNTADGGGGGSSSNNKIITSTSSSTSPLLSASTKEDIGKLCALGFAANDCAKALKISNGRLDDAALWLTQNATPSQRVIDATTRATAAAVAQAKSNSALDIRIIETRAACIRLCLIDDCGDVDVPLAEFVLSNLCATYEFATVGSTITLPMPPPPPSPTLSEINTDADSESDNFVMVKQTSSVIDFGVENSSRTLSVECTLALDYYNRTLGGWEPFIEQWQCRAIWRPEDTILPMTPTRHRIAIHSDDILNVNITDALLSLVRLVHKSWAKENNTGAPKTTPRNPFVPYSLRNDTGCVLYFVTVITEPDEPFKSLDTYWDVNNRNPNDEQQRDTLQWTEVQPGDVVPFSYGSTRSKQRHKESHRMRAHQLAVRVHGWCTAAPVTVDRVGIYFRHVAADRLRQPPDRVTMPRSARLVFDVRLDGSARKLVTIRSALVLMNRLPDSVDVKLVERSTVNAVSTSSRTALLGKGDCLPVPLVHAHSHIFIRPSDPNDSFSYCQPDVPWSRVSRPGDRVYMPLRCTTNRGNAYFVWCEIRRVRYPITGSIYEPHMNSNLNTTTVTTVPAHTIFLLPSLLLVNLLPQDMFYIITATCNETDVPSVVAKGQILPGRSAAILTADPDASLEIFVNVENFRCSSGVNIPSAIQSSSSSSGGGGVGGVGTSSGSGSGGGIGVGSDSTSANILNLNEYSTRIRLEDLERRRLFLRANVEPNRGARVRVTITAPYWIVNRTGMPLVFRQEGVSADTAGQFEEHELARMVAPLLFSFADQDASPTVVARIGYKHGGSKNHGPGTPHWCQQFHLRRGIQVRRLRVSHDTGPDTVYVVGIEVRPALGRRRNQHTSIVVVSPRHQLHNRTRYALEFAQACHATTVRDPAAAAARINAPSGCHVPFHWPRLDRDQLLCIRCIDSGSSSSNSSSLLQFRTPTAWSGGLRIDAPMSCHVLIRDAITGDRVLFLHVEIVPHGATYCVIVSDTDALPPPLRIDNCSDVAITFAQYHHHYYHHHHHGSSSSSSSGGNSSSSNNGTLNGGAAINGYATLAHAHRSVPYAWDEPAGTPKLVLTAPGGISAVYDIDRLGLSTQLTYENFIYIAFTGTFNTQDDLDHYDESDYSTLDISTPATLSKFATRRSKRLAAAANTSTVMDPVRSQRLVLDVIKDSNIVVLAHKQPGKRSQLWRMTSTGQLQHEGSTIMSTGTGHSVPLVLDIETPAPQPSARQPARLVLRRPDPRRSSTQSWKFTADGRLCCIHRKMCVQAQDGLLGLRPGSAAVLGETYDAPRHRNQNYEPHSIPLEQAVGKQRMRPGSGLLSVEITTDGPTRVVRVMDMKQRETHLAKALADDDDWKGVAHAHRPESVASSIVTQDGGDNATAVRLASEIQVTVMLRAGLGVSVIGSGRELIYLQLNNIIAETVCGSRSQELCLSVQDAQCDNQLTYDTECPIVLHAPRARTPAETKRLNALPVLEIRAELQPPAGAVFIFKHFIVQTRPLAIHLEETLLLRLYEFLLTATDSDNDDRLGQSSMDESETILKEYTSGNGGSGTIDYDDNDDNITTTTTTGGGSSSSNSNTIDGKRNVNSYRYHFGIIRLVPGPIRLSVHTAGGGTMPVRLRALKRRLGLTLVGFEDAPVELEPYVRHHPFETGNHLRRSIIEHFHDQLLWQAAAILGSVDFLGSPLGLLGDVTEGVSGLIRERSVGALVLNVAHGLSNSAAKVTESLSDGLGRVTMDDAHEEMRQRIRRKQTGSGGEHIVAGIKGFGFGILGGATGIFKQVYEGAATDGIQGVFSGLGKGLVGAVAKPVVGVLDLATETARAVRDSSRGSSRMIPERRRLPRVTIGPGGLLPPYNNHDSRGQAYLRTLSHGNSSGSSNSNNSIIFDHHDYLLDVNGDNANGNNGGGGSGAMVGIGTSTGGNNDLYTIFSTDDEQYVAYECVRSSKDDLRVIVSSLRVRIVTGAANDTLTIVTETGLNELICCMPVTQDGRHYMEMIVKGGNTFRRPRIRCDTELLAKAVTRQVNYAKRLHEEAAHTLRPQDD